MFCKKKRDRGPARIPTVVTPQPHEIEAWIFFVGHQAPAFGPDYGTRSYNRIKEQPGNQMLVEKIIAKTQGVHNVHMVLRPHSRSEYRKYCSYAKAQVKQICKENGYDIKKVAVVELHYNAAGVPGARGAHSIVSQHNSAVFAFPIQQQWAEDFGLTLRRKYEYVDQETGKKVILEGIKMSQSAAGTGWTRSVGSLGCLTFLWEPFFCDYKTEETSWFFEDIEVGIEKAAQFWQRIIAARTLRLDVDAAAYV